jgi:Spy/CpxP family protein refolding chaperone
MMNLRRATLVFGALLCAGAVFASAQTAPTDQPSNQTQGTQGRTRSRRSADPEKQVQALTKKLNLTADQAAKITPILQDRAQQMQALRADTTVAPADRRTKAKGIMDDSNSKIESVLNDQQKQQFQQMQAQRKARRGSRQPAGSAGGL